MTGIFISYSRKDSQIARKLIDSFQSIGLDVWVDWEDIPPAVGWLDQIFQGIEQADAFIFLVSPDSIASEVCNVELEHARKNAKRIIPLVVRDAPPKDTAPAIRELNWIFIRETDDFKAGVEKVKVAINLDVNWLREHRRLQVRALDWDRKKDPSLLLRGRDLRSAAKMISRHEGKDPAPSGLQKLYIFLSRRSERLRTTVWIAAALAVLIMALLSWAALDQRREAVNFAAEAREQKEIAEKNEDAAIENARAALAAKAAAEKNAVIAKAQRSAARAQIYQSRTGGLFTSTLLGVDSYLRNPSLEAEEILRKNISLLPVPVKQWNQAGAILHVEPAPDGESFAFTSADGTVCLVRFESGENLFCAASPGSMLDADISPNGEWMVTGSSSGEVLVLDTSNGEVLKKINLGVEVFDVNINPDGTLFALARRDGRINFFKRATFQPAGGELSVYGSLRVTAFSPNGRWFAAGSDSGAITFWNLETGKITSVSAHRGEVRDIVFSSDSRYLLSGGADNYAVLTSPSTGKKILEKQAEDWVEDVDFSPNGLWFATASNDFRIRVWDSKNGVERLRLLQDSLVGEVKVSPDGLWIASTGSDRTVRVWSAASGAEIFQIPLDDIGNVLGFSGDGAFLVAGDSRGNLSLWDISSIKSNAGYLRFDDFVGNILVGPNGDWFCASTGGLVWLLDPGLFPAWTAPSGRPILDLSDDAVHSIESNPQGTSIAITTESGKVVLLDVQTHRTRVLMESGPLHSLAFSADGSRLYLGGEDGLLKVRSLDSDESDVFWTATSPIYALAVDGNSIAAGLENQIVVLEIESQSIRQELDAPGRNVLLEFSPSGQVLSSAASSGHTYLWKQEDGAYELEADIVSSPLGSLSFGPDGKRLYLGESDQILILDSQTGGELRRIRQKGSVTGLAFSPDGKTLYTSSLRVVQFFDTALLADISGDDIVEAACNRLLRNFTAAEWDYFFDDDEYIVLCPSLPAP